MSTSSITYSNTLAKIHNKPLKCVITNNKNSIRYLSDSGSMIVYADPVKQDYYEIYLGGKFISGGHGFSEEQYNYLSYIASTYNYSYNDIWDNINDINNKVYSYYNTLDTKKLDTNGNSSYTYIIYEDEYNNQYPIELKNFIDLYTHIPTYDDLTVDNVEYIIRDTNNKEYENGSNILEGTTLWGIICKVSGTINDSGGIGGINIILNKKNSNNQYLSITSITDYRVYYDTSNSNKFEIEISRTFNDTDVDYTVQSGKNELFTQFELSILETPNSKYKNVTLTNEDDQIEIPISFNKIKNHTINLETPVLYGVPVLKYSYDNLNDLTDDQINETVNQMKSIELRYHSLESDPIFTFIPVANMTKNISIYYDHTNYSILNVWFIDKTTSNIYNIQEFMYRINDDIVAFTAVDNNVTDDTKGLPEFINNNGFNTGLIKIEIVSHSKTSNTDISNYTNNYWIPSKYLTS